MLERPQCKHVPALDLRLRFMANVFHSGGGGGTVGYGGGFVAGATSGDKTGGTVRS